MAFTFVTPLPDETVIIGGDGKVAVTINDANHGRYRAAILEFNPAAGMGIGAEVSSDVLSQVGTTDNFSNRLGVDVATNPAVGANNRVVRVEDRDTGDIEGYAFRAVLPGSGQMSMMATLKVQKRCANCSEDQPVPVALVLQLDTKVIAGTCAKCNRLNEATILRHSDDAKYPCSWFSEPIALCGKSGDPGIWMLEKTDATTWQLILQRGKAAAATYTLKTKKKKDCTLPLQLTLTGKGGKECKKWPKTVTVEPAP